MKKMICFVLAALVIFSLTSLTSCASVEEKEAMAEEKMMKEEEQ